MKMSKRIWIGMCTKSGRNSSFRYLAVVTSITIMMATSMPPIMKKMRLQTLNTQTFFGPPIVQNFPKLFCLQNFPQKFGLGAFLVPDGWRLVSPLGQILGRIILTQIMFENYFIPYRPWNSKIKKNFKKSKIVKQQSKIRGEPPYFRLFFEYIFIFWRFRFLIFFWIFLIFEFHGL